MRETPLQQGGASREHDLVLSLNDALHDMSQPLTSVVFAIELSSLDEDEDSRRAMLASARTECNRVLEQVAQMRVVCEQLMHQTSPAGVA